MALHSEVGGRRTSARSGAAASVALACAILAASFRPARAAPSAEDQARVLLDSAGVRGGLVVHVGCGDGELIQAVGAAGPYLVHGLDRDPQNIERARARLLAAGEYGTVSVEQLEDARLPYVSGSVNLLVLDDPGGVPEAEATRVVAPGGSLAVRRGGEWRVTRKARPEGIDHWTHTLYDATNNAAGADTVVGPPHHLQWVGLPLNARHHERTASVSALVSDGGRVFYIIDEAPAASVLITPRWKLVARDAFSGVVLWKRSIPVWEPHLRGFRSGPPEISRRLVAAGGAVYATLGYGHPVVALGPASGRTLREYAGTEDATEIRYSDGRLYVVTASAHTEGKGAPHGERIVVLDAASGRTLWEKPDARPLPTTLAVAGGRVFYHDAEGIRALDADTGAPLWHATHAAAVKRPGFSAPTLVAREDVVLLGDRLPERSAEVDARARKRWARWLVNEGPMGELVAFSAKTGERLWSCECAEVYHAPVDVFVADGLVWVGESPSRTGPDFTAGRDPLTGEVVRRIDPGGAFKTTMPHHRCHRNRVSGGYIVMGRTGIEFIDLKTGESSRHHWTRGVCQYGVLPANGLLYAPPHSCACYIEAKMTGFLAFAPKREEAVDAARPTKEALLRGPAYDDAPPRVDTRTDDWPTYRHDAARSGATPTSVPDDITCLWQASLGGPITAPVVAGGRAYVAAVDAHTMHALDAETGRELWRFTAGGRIDSPPTVSGGRVVFGSADGRVWCLRASDGRLVWRFRAAPSERRLFAFGQLESPWPVSGSVLVRNGEVWFVAGRSSFVDGGMRLYRLDLATGRALAERTVLYRDPVTGGQPPETQRFDMPGALPDVLSHDGEFVYMRHLAFRPGDLADGPIRAHLYSPAGFLNGDWWHRTYWIHGTHFYSGYIGWYFSGRETPAGRLLVVNDSTIYGYGYAPEFYRGATGREYRLFAIDRAPLAPQPPRDYMRAHRSFVGKGNRTSSIGFKWSRKARVISRAMLLAGDKLFMAGPPEGSLGEGGEGLDGPKGGRLAVVSAASGETLRRYELDGLPVYDGMAAARGRVFLSMKDGRLLCLGKPEGRPAPIGPDGRAPLIPIVEKRAARPPDAPEPGLAGRWRFDEGSGSIAFDTSGGRHDADVSGRWVKAALGAALHTGGRTGAVRIVDGPHLHFGTSSFTVALWLAPYELDRRVMGKEDFPRRWWVMNLLKNGRLEMVFGQGKGKGLAVRPTSRTALLLKKWTHAAFVVDRAAREVRCYIDGALDGTTAIPPQLTAALDVKGHDLMMPARHRPFVGLVDELRIYHRALTPADVARIHDDERAGRTGAVSD
jgi:outer membrane protein assembly factor BamB